MVNAKASEKYYTCEKDYSWNPSTCICKNSRYLKSIFDDSVIFYNAIINFTNIVSRNMTNTTSTNVMSTVPINSDDKKNKN